MVSLNEQEFLAERADLDADKEEEKKLKEQEQQEHEVIRRDFYFNEVLAVARDYAQLLEHNKIARAR